MRENSTELPEGLVLTRTTPVFDNDTVPAGLLRAHRLANDVWGRLVVMSGVLGFVFDDDLGEAVTLTAGCTVTIPPERPHHVDLRGYSTFTIEFWKRDHND
jgi:tellurite resistance-related uncharacterized protein